MNTSLYQVFLSSSHILIKVLNVTRMEIIRGRKEEGLWKELKERREGKKTE